jgi:osmoprotectant transport system permease protein
MSTKLKVLVVVLSIVIIGSVMLLLSRSAGEFQAAFNAEFLTRPDGYSGLIRHYEFNFPVEPKQMDSGLMYRALYDGAVDIIDGFSTDGRIPAYNLFVLGDDKDFFPPYYAAPIIRRECLEKLPQLKGILERLAGKISNERMQSLNFEVDEGGKKAEDVAREFLLSAGLIGKNCKAGSGSVGSIVIGSKEFTEQEILGQIMAILIECNSNIEVIRKLNLGSTMICLTAIKAGDLDLYAEYTGTGLVSILKERVINDPDRAYNRVKKEFRKRYNLLWLKPFGFDNTYTLTMRKGHAKRLKIETISDLAKYLKNNRRRK